MYVTAAYDMYLRHKIGQVFEGFVPGLDALLLTNQPCTTAGETKFTQQGKTKW